MKLDSMYQDIILDHYRNPHGKGLRDGDAEVHHVNPTCGDEITLRVKLDGSTVVDVSYESQGCSISQASASVLNDLVVGKSVGEAQAVQEAFLELMQSKGQGEGDEEVLEDAVAFAGCLQVPGPGQVRPAQLDGLEGRHRQGPRRAPRHRLTPQRRTPTMTEETTSPAEETPAKPGRHQQQAPSPSRTSSRP